MEAYVVSVLNWSGVESFCVVGQYGEDNLGRYVVTSNNERYDFPREAIVKRVSVAEIKERVRKAAEEEQKARDAAAAVPVAEEPKADVFPEPPPYAPLPGSRAKAQKPSKKAKR